MRASAKTLTRRSRSSSLPPARRGPCAHLGPQAPPRARAVPATRRRLRSFRGARSPTSHPQP
eukprot:5419115-Prymnesium_polylepis.1